MGGVGLVQLRSVARARVPQSSAGTQPAPGSRSTSAVAGHRGYDRSLEGLRGVAAILVVFAHTLPNEMGFTLGVDIFFVLSGFLITRLIVGEITRLGRSSLRTFYIRRAFRLFPALFVLLLAVVVWIQLVAPASDVQMVHGSALSGLLYVENWHIVIAGPSGNAAIPNDPASQTWSLSVEEQFYLLWPVILILAWKWKGVRSALAVAVCGCVLAFIDAGFLAASGAGIVREYFGSDTRAAELLAGCSIALLAQAGWLPRFRRETTIVALAAILLVAVLQLDFFYQLTAATLLGGVIVAGLSQHDVWPLNSRPAGWVGQRSYALYLWHPFIGAVLFYQFHMRNGLWMLAAVLCISLLIAAATYRFVERPLRAVGRQLTEPGRLVEDSPAEFPFAAILGSARARTVMLVGRRSPNVAAEPTATRVG